jgi:fructoselysine-6-phosphate deglycase
MLNFDPDRYLRIQTGAVNLADPIAQAVDSAMRDGCRNLFFLGTGGAAILMQPAALLLQRQSSFPAFAELSAEIAISGHIQLGKGSLVVIPSLSGNTAESVAVHAQCKAKGATTFAMVGHENSPLAKAANRSFVNFAEDDTSCESFYFQSLLLALSVMKGRGEFSDYGQTLAELRLLPAALLEAKKTFEPEAARIAAALAASPYHIITSSGNCWAEAWYYGMCILEEMQWIKTRPIHAADFFHGTLELVEKGTSVFVLKGEDEFRPLAERVERFAGKLSASLIVIDAAKIRLEGIGPSTRALVAPAVLSALLERVSAHLEVLTNHPLTTRRYYKRMEY